MTHKTRSPRQTGTIESRIAKIYGCRKNNDNCAIAPLAADCVNCRLGVEAAQSRVYTRKIRALGRRKECSSSACVSFLSSMHPSVLKSHLASMAWWRFSLDTSDRNVKKLYDMMRETRICDIPFGTDYMHDALRALKECSPAQLLMWFGHESMYQAVSFYAGIYRSCCDSRCDGCALLHRGCQQANTASARICELRDDEIVQRMMSGKPEMPDGCADDDDNEEENTDEQETGDMDNIHSKDAKEGRASGSGTDCDDNSAADNYCGPEIELAY